jgi:addiction module HigA family antidote
MDRNPPHPGEVLVERFLGPLGITQVALARHLKVSVKTIHQLVHARRSITPHMAWLLSQALGTTPDYWMELQSGWSLARALPKRKVPRLEKAQLTLIPVDEARIR